MLENLGKPVIVTGSQIPLSQIRSDGLHNLLNALYTLAVHIIQLPKWVYSLTTVLYRGNRATKADADGFNAFESPNYPALVEAGIHIEVNQRALLPQEQAIWQMSYRWSILKINQLVW